jgi:putative GTP pyrophosphokinase
MLNKKDFLKKYPTVTEGKIKEAKLSWSVLEAIYDDYVTNHINSLESLSQLITSELMKVDDVHSVRFRVKDAEHLIEKIIRKCLEDPSRKITFDNYLSEITDLIGVRVLHLFKESWISLHNYILEKWNLKETPVAYIRVGDSQTYTDDFTEKGCTVKEHKFGYRSLHFLIETKPSKHTYYAEIQIRTIFEEGWSEIDHKIRYPYNLDNPIYAQYSLMLNRLSGMSDEMGSFINVLQKFIEIKDNEIEERDNKIHELEERVTKSNLNKTEKEDFIIGLNSIKQYDFSKNNVSLPIYDLFNNSAKIFANFNNENVNNFTRIQAAIEKMRSPLMNLPLQNLEALKAIDKSVKNPDLNNK